MKNRKNTVPYETRFRNICNSNKGNAIRIINRTKAVEKLPFVILKENIIIVLH